MPTEGPITGFHQDDVGDWVAELECGHNQHVRHNPPFQLRPWVVTEEGRTERLGLPLWCRLCDRAELPVGLRLVEETAAGGASTVSHRLGDGRALPAGTWAEILVAAGEVRLTASTDPPIDVVLGPGSRHAIPPGVDHALHEAGDAQLSVRVFATDRGAGARR